MSSPHFDKQDTCFQFVNLAPSIDDEIAELERMIEEKRKLKEQENEEKNFQNHKKQKDDFEM